MGGGIRGVPLGASLVLVAILAVACTRPPARAHLDSSRIYRLPDGECFSFRHLPVGWLPGIVPNPPQLASFYKNVGGSLQIMGILERPDASSFPISYDEELISHLPNSIRYSENDIPWMQAWSTNDVSNITRQLIWIDGSRNKFHHMMSCYSGSFKTGPGYCLVVTPRFSPVFKFWVSFPSRDIIHAMPIIHQVEAIAYAGLVVCPTAVDH